MERTGTEGLDGKEAVEQEVKRPGKGETEVGLGDRN